MRRNEYKLQPSKFRWNYRLTATSPAGRHVIVFRIGVGYWPCLYAPFLQIAFGKHIFEFWYGLPSYRVRPPAKDSGRRRKKNHPDSLPPEITSKADDQT